MKLKCIGGRCDGQIIEVDYDYRKGDIIRVPNKFVFSVENIITNQPPSYISDPYSFYKIEEFNFKNPDLDFKFLIPEKWNITEAVRYLLASHHGLC